MWVQGLTALKAGHSMGNHASEARPVVWVKPLLVGQPQGCIGQLNISPMLGMGDGRENTEPQCKVGQLTATS